MAAFSDKTREALSQYLARPTISLKKMSIEENDEAISPRKYVSISSDMGYMIPVQRGWKMEHLQAPESIQPYEEQSTVSDNDNRSTWAKLIAQEYEVYPLTCPRYGSPMRAIAVITEPQEVH
jgi:hypothetical protein